MQGFCRRGLFRPLMLSTVLVTPLIAYGASSGLQVSTDSGVVEGRQDGPVRSFLGIPYAQPPVEVEAPGAIDEELDLRARQRIRLFGFRIEELRGGHGP